MAVNRKSRTKRTPQQQPLGTYLGELAQTRMFTPEQERAFAREIAEARVRLWRAVLSYPPFVTGIAEHLRTSVHDESGETALPRDALDDAVATSRHFRDRETKEHRDAWERARERLARCMAKIDLDGTYVDSIRADLEAIDADRREGLSLRVTSPPRGSRPFATYLERVRHHMHALRHRKNHFVKANLRLVVSIARRFDYGLMPLPDLIQEGNLGLMVAVDRFDPTRGFRFSTYATWWIRHAINRALANKGRTVRLPAHVSADLQKLSRATRRAVTLDGRVPDTDALAELTGLSPARVRKLMSGASLDATLSLDHVADEDRTSAGEQLIDESVVDPGERLDLDGDAAFLHDAMAELQPIEVDILRKRFGLDEPDSDEAVTLRELGERHQLSRERIRQLQERALGKLRREFRRRDP